MNNVSLKFYSRNFLAGSWVAWVAPFLKTVTGCVVFSKNKLRILVRIFNIELD